jgi:hypothetical protein
MEQPGVLVGLITPLFRTAASAKSGGAKTAGKRSGERDPKVGGSKCFDAIPSQGVLPGISTSRYFFLLSNQK